MGVTEPVRRTRFFALLETELLPLLIRGPVLECYFDGANKATEEFNRVVLAMACGAPDQWRDFNADWDALRQQHSAPPLHTTDAAALGGKFCRKYGWDDRRVDDYIIGAVKVIRRYLESGLHVATLTILLEDYRRARNEIALLPKSVNNILVSESMGFCFRLGRQIGAEKYDLHFDRNESFRGHVIDVKESKQALIDVPYFKRVNVCTADVADLTPALQMVDLFAWCISHNDNATRFWHRALNDLPWASRYLDYGYLSKPDMAALERTLGWKLKRRGMEPQTKTQTLAPK